MLGAEHPLPDRQQRGVLVPGTSRIPRRPGPASEVATGGQGLRMLGAGHPLPDLQQRGVLVAGTSRIPRRPGPEGKVATDGQRVRMLGTEHLLPGIEDLLRKARAAATFPLYPRKLATRPIVRCRW